MTASGLAGWSTRLRVAHDRVRHCMLFMREPAIHASPSLHRQAPAAIVTRNFVVPCPP